MTVTGGSGSSNKTYQWYDTELDTNVREQQADIYSREETIGFGAGDAVAANKVLQKIDPWDRRAGWTNRLCFIFVHAASQKTRPKA